VPGASSCPRAYWTRPWSPPKAPWLVPELLC
jgi:hypothetical protein